MKRTAIALLLFLPACLLGMYSLGPSQSDQANAEVSVPESWAAGSEASTVLIQAEFESGEHSSISVVDQQFVFQASRPAPAANPTDRSWVEIRDANGQLLARNVINVERYLWGHAGCVECAEDEESDHADHDTEHSVIPFAFRIPWLAQAHTLVFFTTGMHGVEEVGRHFLHGEDGE